MNYYCKQSLSAFQFEPILILGLLNFEEQQDERSGREIYYFFEFQWLFMSVVVLQNQNFNYKNQNFQVIINTLYLMILSSIYRKVNRLLKSLKIFSTKLLQVSQQYNIIYNLLSMIEQKNYYNRLTPIQRRRLSSVQNNYPNNNKQSFSRQSNNLKQTFYVQTFKPQQVPLNFNLNYTPTWTNKTFLNQPNVISGNNINKLEPLQIHKDLQHVEPLHNQNIPIQSQVQQDQKYIQLRNQFFEIIRKVPVERRLRDQQTLQQLIKVLNNNNMFFKPLSTLFSCSLLKMGRIRFFEQGDIIYDKKQELNGFLIILWGKIKLIDKKQGFKKIAGLGQSLSQQILFTELKYRQQKARAIEDSYLLELSMKSWIVLRQAAISNGLKNEILLVQKWLRRQMLNKNGLRNTKLQ